MDFWSTTFYGERMINWAIGFATLAVALGVLILLKRGLHLSLDRLSKSTGGEINEFLSELVNRTGFLFLLVLSIYIASLTLSLPVPLFEGLQVLAITTFWLQLALWISSLITFIIARRSRRQLADNAGSVTTLNAFGLIARILLWSIVFLLILENLPGVRVDSLIASLGITGVAVALAVQNILGDLFASLSIALDKPFVIGDLIVIDDFTGTVEHVGLKSTRLRSLSGEQLVFSNSDLLSSRIRNYKRMNKRRVQTSLSVPYGTPAEKLEAIPQIVERIITNQPDVIFDRTHLKELGGSALNFEIVYIIESSDYTLYMDRQQAINLELYRRFKEEEIRFAFPTQAIVVDYPFIGSGITELEAISQKEA